MQHPLFFCIYRRTSFAARSSTSEKIFINVSPYLPCARGARYGADESAAFFQKFRHSRSKQQNHVGHDVCQNHFRLFLGKTFQKAPGGHIAGYGLVLSKPRAFNWRCRVICPCRGVNVDPGGLSAPRSSAAMESIRMPQPRTSTSTPPFMVSSSASRHNLVVAWAPYQRWCLVHRKSIRPSALSGVSHRADKEPASNWDRFIVLLPVVFPTSSGPDLKPTPFLSLLSRQPDPPPPLRNTAVVFDIKLYSAHNLS